MKKYPQTQHRQRGSALGAAMLFTLLVGLLVMTIFPTTVFHFANAYREDRYYSAMHVAEAGVEEALWNLSYGDATSWPGWSMNTEDQAFYKNKVELHDENGHPLGQYSVRVINPIGLGDSIIIGEHTSIPWPMPITIDSQPSVTAIAGVPRLAPGDSQIRLVEVAVRARTVFSLGLFSDKTLGLGGTTYVDSYDSRNGPYDPVNNAGHNGDAGSNEDITLQGNVLIDGDAAAGGVVLIEGSSVVTGEVMGGVSRVNLPPVDDLVAAAKLENDNGLIPDAIKSNGTTVTVYDGTDQSLDVAANSTLTLPGGATKDSPNVYYFSDLHLSGNSIFNIDGYVVIFTDGDVDLTGGTTVNLSGRPEEFVMYSSGDATTEIFLRGGADEAGAVYAPRADVKFAGGADIFGAYVGGQISVLGNAEFHYDESLGDTGLVAFFQINEWMEKPAPTLAELEGNVWDHISTAEYTDIGDAQFEM